MVILTNFTLFKLKKFTSSFGFVTLFPSSVKYDQLFPQFCLQQISLRLSLSFEIVLFLRFLSLSSDSAANYLCLFLTPISPAIVLVPGPSGIRNLPITCNALNILAWPSLTPVFCNLLTWRTNLPEGYKSQHQKNSKKHFRL